MSPVIINEVKWCKIRKSDITHTHTRSVADNTLYWVLAEHGMLLFGNFHYISDKNMHVELGLYYTS